MLFRSLRLATLAFAQKIKKSELQKDFYTGIREQIAALESQLASIVGGDSTPAVAPKKGGMSAAGRARVAAAQRARWKKIKAAKGGASVAKSPANKKRTMSPEHRAKLAAAAKARWAKKKAEKGA